MRRSVDMTLKESEEIKIKNKNSEESENKVSEETEICIIRMTEKTEKQNINKLIKNKFFIERAKAMSKKKTYNFFKKY